MLYLLYKFGEILLNLLPLKAGYWLACRIADIKYFTSVKDKRIIINNLKVVLGKDNGRLRACARAVFRNFCKYLVDFFRQHRLDEAYIKKFVKIKGAEHLDQAFKKQKGVIILSAHLGNWELGAAVTAMRGYPLNIIALSHKDTRINDFFDNRRKSKGIKIIQLGGSVKKAFKCLDRNEAIAVLLDRDFSKRDLTVKFFGRDAIIPKGIGIFSVRKNSPVVPCFMIREPDNTYSLIFDRPVEYDAVGNEAEDMKGIVQESIKIIEKYVKKYPEQWFTFEDLWPGKKI